MGFIYRADVFCQPCGEEICTRLISKGRSPLNIEDQSSYDSDDFPKSANVENEEADYPQHCGACRQFLRNPLTERGYMYVWQLLSSGVQVNVAVEEWAPFYGFTQDEDGTWSSNEMVS